MMTKEVLKFIKQRGFKMKKPEHLLNFFFFFLKKKTRNLIII